LKITSKELLQLAGYFETEEKSFKILPFLQIRAKGKIKSIQY